LFRKGSRDLRMKNHSNAYIKCFKFKFNA